jgi:hypothetical protein
MAKKDRKNSKVVEKKSKNLILWIVGTVLVVIAVLVITGNLPLKETEEKGRSFYLQEKETKPVLDPSLFTGVTRAAYAAAQKYPEIMNEVFCYCYCNEPPFNHKTLLSCFTDEHGAG